MFLVITFVAYVIFFLVPADPARQFAGKRATAADVQRVRTALGLDQPVPVQYGRFVWNLVGHQSLGRSFANRQSVNEIVGAAAPVTASLVVGGVLLYILIAIPVGILSALRPRSLLDRVAMVYVLFGISLPSVWVGLLLAYLVGFKLGLTPFTGYCDAINPPPGAQCGGPVQWAYHLVLPWATIAIVSAGIYVRMIRANVMETLNEDFVRTARAKGAPEWRVLRSHVLRNAMLPVVTMIGMDIGLLIGGLIFVEQVFGLPGLGNVAYNSIFNFDLPTTMGITIFASLAILVFNLVTDMLYAWIDPRIRLS